MAFFKDDQLSIKDEFKEYASVADSGNENIRGFCGTCGARLFARNPAREGIMAVAAGCADDNHWFVPQAIVYNTVKPGWDCMDEELPSVDTMPPPAK